MAVLCAGCCLGLVCGCSEDAGGGESELMELISAAECGDAEAQSNLGLCYLDGNGIAQDSVEGVKWVQKAVAQGNVMAHE